jgi:hypothetical protein
MNQSYQPIAGADAWSPWEQAVVASSRGAWSRSCGESSAGNPYLQPGRLPSTTGQDYSTWYSNYESWWRGWDEEDARRQSESGVACESRSAARGTRRNAIVGRKI